MGPIGPIGPISFWLARQLDLCYSLAPSYQIHHTTAHRMPADPEPFLPKKGNYHDLLAYRKSELVYATC
jgi:hypothetical protein